MKRGPMLLMVATIVVCTHITFKAGEAYGREAAAEATAKLWGAQVEPGPPTYRIVTPGEADVVTVPPGEWQRVSITYWIQRADHAPLSAVDVMGSLHDFCVLNLTRSDL